MGSTHSQRFVEVVRVSCATARPVDRCSRPALSCVGPFIASVESTAGQLPMKAGGCAQLPQAVVMADRASALRRRALCRRH
jgi:hypothetical protein